MIKMYTFGQIQKCYYNVTREVGNCIGVVKGIAHRRTA